MGPTLQSADLDTFVAGHASHIDMLHNSPNGMGIEWDRDNVYWVFDGFHSSITRYYFKTDHGKGGNDHSDAQVLRFAEGEVTRLPNVPSHMALDKDTGLLYISDTGNSRIAVLDTAIGEVGAAIHPNYDGGEQYMVERTEIRTLVDHRDVSLESPSGMALHQGLLFVADNATARILAFTKDGRLIDYLDLPMEPGALAGIEFDQEGNLFAVDMLEDRILRIQAPTSTDDTNDDDNRLEEPW